MLSLLVNYEQSRAQASTQETPLFNGPLPQSRGCPLNRGPTLSEQQMRA